MFLILLASACIVQTTLAQCLTSQDAKPKDQAAHRELLRSQLDFSLDLFKRVGSLQPSDNVFISPHSVYNAMLLAYFASERHTEASLREALYLPKDQTKVDMLLSYRLQKILSAAESYKSQVNSANRLFISVNQTVRDCMQEYFSNEIEMVDFSVKGVSKAVNSINNWVANQTNNNIQNLVSVDSVNPGTQLILANAAYFKGVWKYQFDESDTRVGKFYISSNKTVSVPMMYQQSSFSHWRSDHVGAEILELPYKGGEVSLILLLPDPSNETSHLAVNLLKRLDSNSLLNIIKESTDPKNEDKVEIKLPKFTTERTLELTPILEGMGVGDLFQPTSDLTGLTGGPRIQLNSAIHKAKIQLDERGTEAAAATALTDTRIPANTFICDRPFIYLLYDKSKESLLFTGIYNDPTK